MQPFWPRQVPGYRCKKGGEGAGWVGAAQCYIASGLKARRSVLMRSLWSDTDAAAMVARFGASPSATGSAGRDIALCVYASRLLGGDPRLVLHGGGNISVKTVLPDLLGEPVPVLCVKGSGWDM